jgi:serine/threonine protein phosphatase PrpC
MDKDKREKNNISITCSCRCDKGIIRDNNEDNFFFQGMFLDADNEGLDKTLTVSLKADEIKDCGVFMAVFDGMGGISHGEFAAYEAAKYADEFKPRFTGATAGWEAEVLADLCKGMNMRVHAAGIKNGVSVMGTTMASLYFYGDQVWSCNVGDSRCYRYRAGVLEQLSVDHVEELYYIDRINRNRKLKRHY